MGKKYGQRRRDFNMYVKERTKPRLSLQKRFSVQEKGIEKKKSDVVSFPKRFPEIMLSAKYAELIAVEKNQLI